MYDHQLRPQHSSIHAVFKHINFRYSSQGSNNYAREFFEEVLEDYCRQVQSKPLCISVSKTTGHQPTLKVKGKANIAQAVLFLVEMVTLVFVLVL